jgi:putative transposase
MKNRKRNRKLGYDYSQDNLYFVTICVKDMVCCFGDVVGTARVGTARVGTARVGTARELSVRDLNSIHNSRSIHDSDSNDYSQKEMILNEFGEIVERQWLWLGEQYSYVKLHSFVVMPNHVHGILEIDSCMDRSRPVRTRPVSKGEEIKIKSVSQLIGAFKTTSSKWIHLAGYDSFSWQRSFYDHIIRNDISYYRISDYIDSNPERWQTDVFFEKAKTTPIV